MLTKQFAPLPPQYPFGEVGVGEYLRRWARVQPDATAIVYYGQRISYGELDDLSERFALLLQDRGIVPGDRVSVYMGNCPQFLIAFYAIMKLGAVHVPTNPMFKPAELLHQLRDTDARVVITHHHLHASLEEVRASTCVEHVFVTGAGEMLPASPDVPVPETLLEAQPPCPGATQLLAALASLTLPSREQEGEGAAPQPDLDAPAVINYTGGTTGAPKGCIHTQRDLLYTAACAVPNVLRMGPADVSLVFFPVFWTSGQNAGVFIPIFSGSSVALLARWDPVAVMAAIDRYGATHTKMMVDNVVDLLAHPARDTYDLRSLRFVHTVGFVKKLNREIRAQWTGLTGSVICESGWGMTETQSHDTFVTGMQEDDFDLASGQGFVGLTVPGTSIKIADSVTGHEKPFGDEGEICVRTPSIFKGYWERGGVPAPVLRDGWFHTGDTGVMSKEGFIWYLGRGKDMLKVRGMSVYPGEIEAVLGQHEHVRLCAVVGKPDVFAGELPVGYVCLRPGAATSAQELGAWCRERLANYKVPEIRIVDAMALTVTGKVRKEELRKLLSQGA